MARNVVEQKLENTIIQENQFSRVTFSKDLYNLWKDIIYESTKPEVQMTIELTTEEMEIFTAAAEHPCSSPNVSLMEEITVVPVIPQVLIME